MVYPSLKRRMYIYFCLAMGISGATARSMPQLENMDTGGREHDIMEINKDLNLTEGDIMEVEHRSSILGKENLWKLPVPFVLSDSLDMNARGVILRAFERFRLKTCIEFKLWENEPFHISFEKQTGCWSYIGRQFEEQQLSIGQFCDEISTVEHEILHALGFFHEQSRYDRDDYVRILWENIEEGKEFNFRKELSNTSSTQGTPYDYWSVMHYGQDFFSNGAEPTIITKDPRFQNVIGQRQDMSPFDVQELNMLYGCNNNSISFLDHCSFDEGMCEMTSVRWQRVRQADGGPQSDHSNLGMESQDSSFFMHVSTAAGDGTFPTLRTTRMTPKRACKVQCLEFFYYHSGNETDQLNIWIIEFDSKSDTMGTRTLMGQITGSPADYWQLHHVPLNATKTFQVEFEARNATGEFNSGFSVDDINLSETECPHQIWQIRNLEQHLNTSTSGSWMAISPKYYTSDGYRYQSMLRPLITNTETYIYVFIRLVSGDFDDQLQWPLNWRQMTFHALDQNPDIRQRMSKERSITTDPASSDGIWTNPRVTGENVTNENGEIEYYNRFAGIFFTTLETLRASSFLKGGDFFLLLEEKDISELQNRNSPSCPLIPVPVSATPSPATAVTDESDAGSKMPFPSVILVVMLVLFANAVIIQ